MFYMRKARIAPSKIRFLDLGILIFCIAGTGLASLSIILLKISSDFLLALEHLSTASLVIIFIYFDVDYTFIVLKETKTRASRMQKIQLFAPTASVLLMNLFGGMAYKFGWDNFYSTCLWNLGYAIYPIVVTQSVITSGVSSLFEGPKLSVLSTEN